MPKELPSISYLHKVLRYEPDTGFLYWRERTPDMFTQNGTRPVKDICTNWNAKMSGKRGFTTQNEDGYHQGTLYGNTHRAVHVVWALCKGVWPRDTGLWVDHINNIRSDDRLANLQLLTPSQNARKRLPTDANPSGVIGVSFDKDQGKWRARIRSGGKRVHLGRYTTLEEAAAVREAAEKEYGYGVYA